MDTQLASYLISILNGTSFLGRLILGILADKASLLNMLCGAALCSGILILCWQTITTSAAIIVFSALYGFFSGAIVSLMSVSLAHVPKDPRDIGTYMGMGMAVVLLAALAGPPISGAFVTSSGGYDHVAIFSCVVVLAGGFIVLAVKQVCDEGIFGKI
jgi:MFS family permease